MAKIEKEIFAAYGIGKDVKESAGKAADKATDKIAEPAKLADDKGAKAADAMAAAALAAKAAEKAKRPPTRN